MFKKPLSLTLGKQWCKRIPAARELIVEHIDGAIDDLGEEIDKIETELKAKYPEIKHVDLEQN